MDPKVIFRAKDHSYWLGSGPIEGRTKLRSVNTLWGKYMTSFDSELGYSRGALAYVIGYNKFWKGYWPRDAKIKTEADLKKFYGKYMDDLYYELRSLIKSEWDYGNVLGTALHDEFEERAYTNGYVVNPFDGKKYETKKIEKQYDNQSVVDDLWDLEDGCYPELVVWHENSLGCGQVDLPFIRTIDGIRYVDIFDLKSNGGVDKETGEKKREEITKLKKKYLGKGKGHLECTGPLKGLYDCKRVTYQGQLSMYGRCMEEAGYICENVGIGHCLEYDLDTMQIIKMDYLGGRAKAVLEANS